MRDVIPYSELEAAIKLKCPHAEAWARGLRPPGLYELLPLFLKSEFPLISRTEREAVSTAVDLAFPLQYLKAAGKAGLERFCKATNRDIPATVEAIVRLFLADGFQVARDRLGSGRGSDREPRNPRPAG